MVIGVIIGCIVLLVIVLAIRAHAKRKEESLTDEEKEIKKSNKKPLLTTVIILATFCILIVANIFIPHSLWLKTQTVADFFDVESSEVPEELQDTINDDQYVVNGFLEIVKHYKANQHTVIIPEKANGKPITMIANSAFEDTQTLEQVKFAKESKVALIGGKSFARCSNLKEVHLPKSVKLIGNQAFANSLNLKTIKYDGTSEEWGEVKIALDAFYGLEGITIICTDEQFTIDFYE